MSGELESDIAPTKEGKAPVLSNLYLGPSSSQVGNRHPFEDAIVDHVERAMQAVQNFGKTKPTYGGHAYTFSFPARGRTASFLLLSHWGSWQVNDDLEAFRKGLAAHRYVEDVLGEIERSSLSN
ncbi:hypothetical protein ACHAQJ_002181 [Trichoderma viride]